MSYRMKSSTVLGAVVMTTLVTFAGCSSSSSKTGSSATTASPSRSFTVETPNGGVSVSLDGRLPSAWPSSFPIPSGATPAGSGSVAGSTKSNMIAVFETTGSGPDTFNFYKTSSALSVSEANSVGAGNSFVGHLTVSGSYSGSVTVTEHSSQTVIVIYLDTSSTAPGS